jgi:hypothetical protein
MFGIEIKDGVARPTAADRDLVKGSRLHSDELIMKALWEIVAHGGNVAAACRSMQAQGFTNSRGQPINRRTMQKWKESTYRNKYEEMRVRKSRELDELLAADAQANAMKLGKAMDVALTQTMAGIAGANAVESSQVLRNISQARQGELQQGSALRGTDSRSKVARGLSELASELAGLGSNIVRIENEDPESGVVEAEVLSEEDVLEVAREERDRVSQ